MKKEEMIERISDLENETVRLQSCINDLEERLKAVNAALEMAEAA